MIHKMNYLEMESTSSSMMELINMGMTTVEDALKNMYIQGMVDMELLALDQMHGGEHIIDDLNKKTNHFEIDIVKWSDVYEPDGSLK